MATAKTVKTVKTPAIQAAKGAEHADSVKLSEMITKALRAYEKGRDGIQKAALAVLLHARRYKDYSASLTLITGLSDSNGKAMRLWFEKFGGFKYDLEAQKCAGWEGVKHIEDNFEVARGKPWYTMTPPNAFAGASFEEDIRKVLTKYNKLREKASNGKLSDADKAKIDFHVSAEAINTLMKMCNFEILGDKLVDTSPVQTDGTAPVVDAPVLANAA